MPTTILNLPREVLLMIAKYLRCYPQFGNIGHLLHFSLAHSCFRYWAQEAMLLAPTCHLLKLGLLMRTYSKYPDLAYKAKSLDITSHELAQHNMELYRPNITTDEDFGK